MITADRWRLIRRSAIALAAVGLIVTLVVVLAALRQAPTSADAESVPSPTRTSDPTPSRTPTPTPTPTASPTPSPVDAAASPDTDADAGQAEAPDESDVGSAPPAGTAPVSPVTPQPFPYPSHVWAQLNCAHGLSVEVRPVRAWLSTADQTGHPELDRITLGTSARLMNYSDTTMIVDHLGVDFTSDSGLSFSPYASFFSLGSYRETWVDLTLGTITRAQLETLGAVHHPGGSLSASWGEARSADCIPDSPTPWFTPGSSWPSL